MHHPGFNTLSAAAVSLLLLGSQAAPAAKLGDMDVSINGFLTAAAAKSNNDDSNYQSDISDEWKFDPDSVLGLQISVVVTDDLDLTALLISRGEEDHDLETDWAYVGYTLNDAAKLRAGRVKFPAFLVSDYLDVGFAYPWIRPPVEMYSLVPIFGMNGADLLFDTQLMSFDITLNPYVGSESDDAMGLDFDAEQMVGLNVSAALDWITLRVGYVETKLTFETGGITLVDEADASFLGLGTQIDWNNLVIYAEFGEADIDDPAFPSHDAWYVTAGYRFGKWLPHVTYAKRTSDDTGPGVREQQSTTFGVRYDLTGNLAFKAEFSRVEPEAGTYGLFEAPGVVGPAFMPKDDANIMSFGIDMVF